MRMEQTTAETVIRAEFDDAANAIAHLFSFTNFSFKTRRKPRLVLDTEVNNAQFLNDYDTSRRAIIMSPADITKYTLGRDAGRCLYFMANSAIYQKAREYNKLLIGIINEIEQLTPQALERQTKAFNMATAHSQLELAVAHYCGIAYNEDGRYQSPNSAGVLTAAANLKEQTDEADLQREFLIANAQGMKIAEILYDNFGPEVFRPIPRLGVQEAGERIRLLTDIDILQ